jgi:hypothetical protein
LPEVAERRLELLDLLGLAPEVVFLLLDDLAVEGGCLRLQLPESLLGLLEGGPAGSQLLFPH